MLFAAASFSETAPRKLGQRICTSFLLGTTLHFKYKPSCSVDSPSLTDDIRRFIEPFMLNSSIPLAAAPSTPMPEDMLRAASKLHATREDIARMLARAAALVP